MELVTIRYLSPRREGFGREEAYRQHCKKAAKLLSRLNLNPLESAHKRFATAVVTVKSKFSALENKKKVLDRAISALDKLPNSAKSSKVKSLQNTVDKAKVALERSEAIAREAEKRLQEAQSELARIRASNKDFFVYLAVGLGYVRGRKFDRWVEVRGDADPDELLTALHNKAT